MQMGDHIMQVVGSDKLTLERYLASQTTSKPLNHLMLTMYWLKSFVAVLHRNQILFYCIV